MKGSMSKTRLEAFSDGVLAVAITLLVLDLHVNPLAPEGLARQLADQWPSFAAFGVSFLVIGVIWVNHHVVLGMVTAPDRVLLFDNLLLLAFVVSVPFTTSTLAGYLASGRTADIRLAVLLYGASMTGMAIAFTLLFARATRPTPGEGPAWPPSRVRAIARFGVGVVLYPLVALVGLVNAPIMLLVYAALNFYYMFNQAGNLTPGQGSD
jgi:uncharacterized membrane protein